jgi:predicted RNA polymerase sigma factor
MWSIAATTKSTGTTLMRPPSMPMVGIQLGKHLAHLLDQLEEVVGAVDLVHFAGARVADDDAGRKMRQGILHSLRTIPSESCLVRK